MENLDRKLVLLLGFISPPHFETWFGFMVQASLVG